jgi:hypothetical protein
MRLRFCARQETGAHPYSVGSVGKYFGQALRGSRYHPPRPRGLRRGRAPRREPRRGEGALECGRRPQCLGRRQNRSPLPRPPLPLPESRPASPRGLHRAHRRRASARARRRRTR